MDRCARCSSGTGPLNPFLLLAAAASTFLLGTACSEQGTEIVFVIESDLSTPDDVNRLELSVGAATDRSGVDDYDSGGETLTIGPSADDDLGGFPVRYVVRAGSRYHTRVWLKVAAYRDGLRVVATSAGTEFVPGQSVTATLRLPSDVTCETNESVCDGACTDTRSRIDHCGWCGHVCGTDEPCVNGTCQCPGGKERCVSACVDLANDPLNCGACANRCSTGQVCWEGVCQAECPAGTSNCSGWCFDTTRDHQNCGACGFACAVEQGCVDGACGSSCAPKLAGGACNAIEQCPCGGGERCDLVGWPTPGWDPTLGPSYPGPEYCIPEVGAAVEGEPCPSGFECAPGLACIANANGDGVPACMRWCLTGAESICPEETPCVAVGGQDKYGVCRFGGLMPDWICNGIDDDGGGGVDSDVDFANDIGNCGFCGNMCPPGWTCLGGSCQSDCPDGWLTCDAGCFEPWSRENCGWCGNVCPPFWACDGVQCLPDCGNPAYALACPSPSGGWSCVATLLDPTNCGGCGAMCASGSACVDGSCSNTCGSLPETVCPDGFCRLVRQDPDACPGCGDSCAAGHACTDGACTPCDPPPLFPDGECQVTTGCGCGPHEHCIIVEVDGGRLTEMCMPRTDKLGEGDLCHPLAADCDAGLVCVPFMDSEEEAYCVRVCLLGSEPTGCSAGKFCAPVSGSLGGYGICLVGASSGGVGSRCEGDGNCSGVGINAACLLVDPRDDTPLPGGYCSRRGCMTVGCPAGSTCEALSLTRDRFCLLDCTSPIDCRFWDGYECTMVGTGEHCWIEGSVRPTPGD